MKRIIKTLGIYSFLLMSFVLASCDLSNQQKEFIDAEEFYGLGAVTTVNLLENHTSLGKKSRKEEALISSEYLDKFNEYFMSLDYFLGEELIQTTVEENKDSEYSYETKMTISGKDMNGNLISHILYYTEVLIDEDIDDDEISKTFALTGVMKENEVLYYLRGEREVEDEIDESENEIKIRAYKDQNDLKNFVEMKHETSIEEDETEKEYTYRVYVDGKLQEETKVEFETEQKRFHNQKEKEILLYEIEFLNGSGKGKYSVEATIEDDVANIKVKYNINGKTGKFYIKKTLTEDKKSVYNYIFSDASYTYS